MIAAYAIASGLVVLGVLYGVSYLLDELATRQRLRRMRDDVRRRQLADIDRRYGVHDHRPPT